jgi:hypothetical protein
MALINLLRLNEPQRHALIQRARHELAAGDERLARELLVAAGQQLAARIRHHVDEAVTSLNSLRASLLENTAAAPPDSPLAWSPPGLPPEPNPANGAFPAGTGRLPERTIE